MPCELEAGGPGSDDEVVVECAVDRRGLSSRCCPSECSVWRGCTPRTRPSMPTEIQSIFRASALVRPADGGARRRWCQSLAVVSPSRSSARPLLGRDSGATPGPPVMTGRACGLILRDVDPQNRVPEALPDGDRVGPDAVLDEGLVADPAREVVGVSLEYSRPSLSQPPAWPGCAPWPWWTVRCRAAADTRTLRPLLSFRRARSRCKGHPAGLDQRVDVLVVASVVHRQVACAAAG